jgi:hypothetical protein
MVRFLALFLLAVSTPLPADAAPRNFSVISFDRIRVEAPFDVTLVTNKAPFARAEGPAAALDTIDLRVEGRTLILRQRGGSDQSGKGGSMRISLGTPDLRTATLIGGGRLSIDRMSAMAVTLGLAGPGQLKVSDVRAERVDLIAAGSGTVDLAGTVKKGVLAAQGSIVLDAAGLKADELVIQATGSSEVRASARRSVDVAASGGATVALQSPVACLQKVTGAASVSNCR